MRWVAAGAAVVILAAGLGVRAAADGGFAKYAGVALYAALVYALAVVAAPGRRPLVVAAAALAFCWAVELAQLTPWPARLSARSTAARLVLGSAFNPPDLLWYAVGVAAMLALHQAVRRGAVSRRA